jgi:hypothetical protein
MMRFVRRLTRPNASTPHRQTEQWDVPGVPGWIVSGILWSLLLFAVADSCVLLVTEGKWEMPEWYWLGRFFHVIVGVPVMAVLYAVFRVRCREGPPVMAIVDVRELTGHRNAEEANSDLGLVLTDEPVGLRKLWGLVLLIAFRDRATAVHYHPWRGENSLSYVVESIQYYFMAPPSDLADSVIEVALTLFAPGSQDRSAGGARHRNEARSICSSVELNAWGDVTVWDVLVWSTGERQGVDLYRITPPVGASWTSAVAPNAELPV